MGVVPPQEGFLESLRQITESDNALLIFDEVMTGFRVHPGGAQTLYNIKPDITALGKVIGGGLPVGAYGGRRDIMEMVAPAGPMYQAGTLSGNPLAMAGGIATLSVLQDETVWPKLEETTTRLTKAIGEAAEAAKVTVQQTRVGTMFCTFFNDQPVNDWDSVAKSDTEKFGRFFQALLANGVYLPPSQFEACFISTEHQEEALSLTVEAFSKAFDSIRP
jgi:glutamate-1-semialdehyde 2,1-aminomutase